MNYSRGYLLELNKDGGFIQSNLEKVVRLLDVLTFISSELDPEGEKLVLKGGTAINLLYTSLSRLSVDIDLDYIGSLDKETANRDRTIIMATLDDFMIGEGYLVSSKSRGSAILDSRTYAYVNALGNRDNIKVEINFIDRIHIGMEVRKNVRLLGKDVTIATLLEEELFGMKICALIDRSKPRDLFDVHNLMSHLPLLDVALLKKMVVFYLSLDGIYEINDNTLGRIETITKEDVKKELFPVLAKGYVFDLDGTKAAVVSFLKGLLSLTTGECKYLSEFSKGNFCPGLLFDGVYTERAIKHPMARWRVINNKK